MTVAVPTRADHLTEVLSVLYPPPWSLAPGTGTAVGYRLVPYRRRPRLLVPAEPSLAAAGLRSVTGGGAAARLGLRLAAAVPAVTGLLPTLRVYGPPGADHFARHVTEALGIGAVHLVVHVGGPARANRKPVVALLDPAGHPIGYAKLGTTALTRDLVRTERAALRTLGNAVLRYARVPALRHGDTWHGHEVVVQSVLPVSGRPRHDPGLLLRAMREVARSRGTHRVRLADAPYWSGLRERARDRRLVAAADRLRHTAGEVELEYGAWHGDWSPWNCHVTADAVLVWDWERFAVGVPLGYDVLHHRLAAALDGPRPATALADPAGLLAPFELSPEQARTTAALYLIEIATRYLTDGQRTAAAGTVMTLLERTFS